MAPNLFFSRTSSKESIPSWRKPCSGLLLARKLHGWEAHPRTGLSQHNGCLQKQQKMQILKFKPINLGIEPKLVDVSNSNGNGGRKGANPAIPWSCWDGPPAAGHVLQTWKTLYDIFIYIYMCVCVHIIYIWDMYIYVYRMYIIYIRRLFSTVSSDKGHLRSRKISLMASSLKWPDDIVMAAMGCYGKVLISLASGLENQVNTSRETSYIR